MTYTEVFADALFHNDVILAEMVEGEGEVITVGEVRLEGPWAIVYPSEGAPIHFYRNDPVQVLSGPSKAMGEREAAYRTNV